jgi:hypothetical protein
MDVVYLNHHFSEEENKRASRHSGAAASRARHFAKLTSTLLVQSSET